MKNAFTTQMVPSKVTFLSVFRPAWTTSSDSWNSVVMVSHCCEKLLLLVENSPLRAGLVELMKERIGIMGRR